MSLKTIVVVISAVFLHCVLTEAKVIKLSMEEMVRIRGNDCPQQQYCREKCETTGTQCQPPNGTGVPCDAAHIGEICYACILPPEDETCNWICTTNSNQNCTPDPDKDCPMERVGTCQDQFGEILCATTGSSGYRCTGGPMRQCH